MRFGRPIKVSDGLFQLRAVGARVTVIAGGDQVLMVDAGARRSLGSIVAGLDDLGLSENPLRQVVLTHYHPDHTGGLAELVRGRDIRVIAHRSEAAIVEGREPPPNPFRQRFIGRAAEPAIRRLAGAPVPVTDTVEDGDTIPFETEIGVVHVPGHTAGSIALHLPEKGAIVVGDALQYRLGRALSPPARAVTQDPEEAMRSLARLLELDFDVICFSHFPPMRKGGKEALRRLLERQRVDLAEGGTLA